VISFNGSIVIERRIESVFEYVTDLEKNPMWQSGMENAEITSEGPVSRGTTYRCTNTFMGKRYETEGVVSEYSPNRKCFFRFRAGDVTGETRFIFESVDGTTHFTAEGEIHLSLFFPIKNLANLKAERKLKQDLSDLKEILENGGERISLATGRG
jgi:uncharacterized protein YndB with AHSA1/START domain